ncbi:MAG: UbiA prenyltransferase family protein [Planctomycetia bacterium]|nr:UbiA prenyltransferase family protein [Planctomycetia bacterium]
MNRVLPYIQIARPDHWFKNVFMLLGVVLAFFYLQETCTLESWNVMIYRLCLGFFATCIVASSNYVINEILDAPTDRSHPTKRNRPIPSGKVSLPLAYFLWLFLAVIGLGASWTLGKPFFFSALTLWIMGMIYNIPPVRSKEWIYLDVISESVNNPLRLLLGWYAITDVSAQIPPISLIISYWMVGAFFMATKRFAELRWIGNKEVAAAYRASFRYYTETNLLVSMFIYAVASALFLGVFIVRYHVELIFSVPFLAGFFGYYLYIGLKPDSPVQHPEHLYKETGLMMYLFFCTVLFFVLMFIRIPVMHKIFNVESTRVPELWTIGEENFPRNPETSTNGDDSKNSF